MRPLVRGDFEGARDIAPQVARGRLNDHAGIQAQPAERNHQRRHIQCIINAGFQLVAFFGGQRVQVHAGGKRDPVARRDHEQLGHGSEMHRNRREHLPQHAEALIDQYRRHLRFNDALNQRLVGAELAAQRVTFCPQSGGRGHRIVHAGIGIHASDLCFEGLHLAKRFQVIEHQRMPPFIVQIGADAE